MNTEMQNFKQAYEEMLKERETIQAKARKYDELKEAVVKAKEEIEKCFYGLIGYDIYYANGFADSLDIINKHTEELI